MTHRFAHYVLLVLVLALVALPNLGSMALWDMDEGVNAECGREMLETGTWIVPTFNYELRTAKPVMLYWLQRFSFQAFGVNEWAARFPSVLLSLGTLLLVYELGRGMFGARAGLLAGVALASSVEFVKLTRAATPDAAFIFFSTLTLAAFWFGSRNGSRRWFVPTAMAAALAVLTKGPAGLALPGLVIVLYLAWNRELKRLLDWRLAWAFWAFVLVAAPWYALVATETRGAYLRAFIGHENVNRFLAPMESHRGPFYYYVIAVILFFAPWSAVIAATIINAIRCAQRPRMATDGLSESTRANRFLLVWIASYLVFFSFAATKLPNYIAPLYPALALLTADFLVRWASRELSAARWVMPAAIAGLFLTGVVVSAGFLISSGTVAVNFKGLRIMPDLAPWAALGLIPIAGGIATILLVKRNQHERVPLAWGVMAVIFIGLLAAFPTMVVDAAKGPKALVQLSGAHQPERDIRLASLEYTQESVTFYAERKVARLYTAEAAAVFLAMPRPSYLFVPAKVWDERIAAAAGPHRIAARCYDFNRNADILVVTNDGVNP